MRGNPRQRTCAVCRQVFHSEETIRLEIGSPAGRAREHRESTARVCWACIESIRETVPEARPMHLSLLEGYGQGNLFRKLLRIKLRRA